MDRSWSTQVPGPMLLVFDPCSHEWNPALRPWRSVFCGFICQFRGNVRLMVCIAGSLNRLNGCQRCEMSRDGWMIWMIWMNSCGGIWKTKTGLRISLLCRYRAAVLLPVRAAHHSVDACDPGFAIVAKFTRFSSTGYCQYIVSMPPYFTILHDLSVAFLFSFGLNSLSGMAQHQIKPQELKKMGGEGATIPSPPTIST